MRFVWSCGLVGYFGVVLGVGCTGQITPVDPAWSCPSTTEALQTQILQPSCGTTGCHGSSAPAMGLDLVSAGLESRLVDVSSNGCGQILVTPGDPGSSYLVQKLTQSAPTCGDPMPLGGQRLPQQQLSCIDAWITSMRSFMGGTGGSASGGSTGGGGTGGTGTGGTGTGGAGTGGMGTGGMGTGGTGTGGMGTGGTGTGGKGTGATGTGGTGTGGMGTGGTGTGGMGTGGTGTGGTGTGGTGCGPTVAFASQVQPIFSASCTNGCHSGTRPAAGMSLASGSAYANIVNVRASSTCTTMVRVSPSSVAGSYLMNKLTGVGICSGSQMPKAGSSLPSAQLQLISSWICEGAPNN
jgi:hypothetical protein